MAANAQGSRTAAFQSQASYPSPPTKNESVGSAESARGILVLIDRKDVLVITATLND
jgi:hypothetical protein